MSSENEVFISVLTRSVLRGSGAGGPHGDVVVSQETRSVPGTHSQNPGAQTGGEEKVVVVVSSRGTGTRLQCNEVETSVCCR